MIGTNPEIPGQKSKSSVAETKPNCAEKNRTLNLAQVIEKINNEISAGWVYETEYRKMGGPNPSHPVLRELIKLRFAEYKRMYGERLPH